MPAPTFRVDPQTVLHVDPQAGPMQGRPQWWDEAWKCQACLQATDRALAAERELASLKSTVQLERHQREKLNVLVPEIIAQRNEKSNEEAKQEKMRVRIEILESDQTREHKAFEAYKHASQAELDALKLKLKPRTPFEEAIAVLPEHLLLPFEGPVIAMLGEWREAESLRSAAAVATQQHAAALLATSKQADKEKEAIKKASATSIKAAVKGKDTAEKAAAAAKKKSVDAAAGMKKAVENAAAATKEKKVAQKLAAESLEAAANQISLAQARADEEATKRVEAEDTLAVLYKAFAQVYKGDLSLIPHVLPHA